jgi:DNA-binding CsgD family transcriptional regulator
MSISAKLQKYFSLTSREAEVAVELMRNISTQEIASRLGISRNTLKTHRHRIYGKMGIQRQLELVFIGLKLNSVDESFFDGDVSSFRTLALAGPMTDGRPIVDGD